MQIKNARQNDTVERFVLHMRCLLEAGLSGAYNGDPSAEIPFDRHSRYYQISRVPCDAVHDSYQLCTTPPSRYSTARDASRMVPFRCCSLQQQPVDITC